mmetsp:Transcript_95467/g.273825  ORF Transcript_95467/g.273825 Transcript_95467/m.273825 type:complete len:219 (-) Transcript_95467:322-978(-)
MHSLTTRAVSSWLPMSARSQGSSPAFVRAVTSQTSKSWSKTSHRTVTAQAACKAVQPRLSLKSGSARASKTFLTASASRRAAASTSIKPRSICGARSTIGGQTQTPALASLGAPPGSHTSTTEEPAAAVPEREERHSCAGMYKAMQKGAARHSAGSPCSAEALAGSAQVAGALYHTPSARSSTGVNTRASTKIFQALRGSRFASFVTLAKMSASEKYM